MATNSWIPGCAIQRHLPLAKPRTDKYEKKPKYWIEEDLEFEWERNQAREVTDEGQYEVSGDAPIAPSAIDPMNIDMSLASGGWVSKYRDLSC